MPITLNQHTASTGFFEKPERIDNIESFLKWLPEMVRHIERLPDRSDIHPTERIVETIRKYMYSDDFAFWIIPKGSRAVGFVACFVGQDLYGDRFGEIWMASGEPGSYLKHFFWTIAYQWFKAKNIKNIMALDTVKTAVKTRWLRSLGMKDQFVVYQKEI